MGDPGGLLGAGLSPVARQQHELAAGRDQFGGRGSAVTLPVAPATQDPSPPLAGEGSGGEMGNSRRTRSVPIERFRRARRNGPGKGGERFWLSVFGVSDTAMTLRKKSGEVGRCFHGASGLGFRMLSARIRRLAERWMSGLSRTPGKRVWDNIPTRVRIPLSPPKCGLPY